MRDTYITNMNSARRYTVPAATVLAQLDAGLLDGLDISIQTPIKWVQSGPLASIVGTNPTSCAFDDEMGARMVSRF